MGVRMAESTPIGELIARVMNEHGLSYEDISRRSGDDSAGQRAFNLRTKNPPPQPKVATIRAVAKGLGISEYELWTALGPSLGIPAPDLGSDLQRRFRNPAFDVLDDADVAALYQLAKRLADARRDARPSAPTKD